MLADRVKESSTTTGTGTLTTLGAATGFRTFLAAFGTGNRAYYVIENGAQWEVGIGTVTSGFLSRDTIIVNSDGTTTPVNLTAGTKTVYNDVCALVISTMALLQDLNASAFKIEAGSGITVDDNLAIHCKQPITVDTDGATITFDMWASNEHQVTLGGNRALAVANVTPGQRFLIKLIQDATGSRLVTWWTTIRWPGGTAPTLTTTPNKADWFGFVLCPDGVYDGFPLGFNF